MIPGLHLEMPAARGELSGKLVCELLRLRRSSGGARCFAWIQHTLGMGTLVSSLPLDLLVY